MIQFENFNSGSTKIINKAIGTFGLLTILFCSIFINPEKAKFLTCYFQELTGHPCPACGLSHSFYAVSHLHLLDSLKFHLMGPILFFSLLLISFKFAFETVTKKEIQINVNPKIIKISSITFSGIWLIYWITRFLGEL